MYYPDSDFLRFLSICRYRLPFRIECGYSSDFWPPDVTPGVPHAAVEVSELRVPLAVVGEARVVRRVGLEAPPRGGFAQHHGDVCNGEWIVCGQ